MENEVLTLMPNNEETVEKNNSGSGLGAGLAMLIGSGLTLAAVAGGRLAKKAWDKHKAKKEVEVCETVPAKVQEVKTTDSDSPAA